LGLRGRRHLLLLALAALLFLRQVMPDCATGDRTDDGMVTRHVSRHGADGSALKAASRLGLPSAGQDRQRHHGDYECLQPCSPCHEATP
jgi:hypothetical protein